MSLGRSSDGRLFTRDGRLCVGCCDPQPSACAFPLPSCQPLRFILAQPFNQGFGIFKDFGNAAGGVRFEYELRRFSARNSYTRIDSTGAEFSTGQWNIFIPSPLKYGCNLQWSLTGFGDVPNRYPVLCNIDAPQWTWDYLFESDSETLSGPYTTAKTDGPIEPLIWTPGIGPGGDQVFYPARTYGPFVTDQDRMFPAASALLYGNSDNQYSFWLNNTDSPNHLRLNRNDGNTNPPIDFMQTRCLRLSQNCIDAAFVPFFLVSTPVDPGTTYSASTTFAGFDNQYSPTYQQTGDFAPSTLSLLGTDQTLDFELYRPRNDNPTFFTPAEWSALTIDDYSYTFRWDDNGDEIVIRTTESLVNQRANNRLDSFLFVDGRSTYEWDVEWAMRVIPIDACDDPYLP